MKWEEYAVGTEFEKHSVRLGYFTAEIQKSKALYNIICAETCPFELTRIEVPNEVFTAKNLIEAKHKVKKLYEIYSQANSEKQAELSKLWSELNNFNEQGE